MTEKRKESFLEWFTGQMEKAWRKCKEGELILFPKKVIEKMPPSFAKRCKKDYEKYGGAMMNKLRRHSTKKTAFELGFSKGWALALDTDEGFKWAKYNYEMRKKSNESEEMQKGALK